MRKLIVSSIVALSAFVALTVSPASFATTPRTLLEGAWDSQVTLTDCNGNTLVTFRAYAIFNRGGTLTSTDNMPPTAHGPGLGTWERIGGRNYTAPFQFFNFNPDGSFAGVQKINRTITLAADANSFTSVVAFDSYDPNGNLLFSGCGFETAARLP